MATSFNGGRSGNTRKEPPPMDKQLVNVITFGCESSRAIINDLDVILHVFILEIIYTTLLTLRVRTNVQPFNSENRGMTHGILLQLLETCLHFVYGVGYVDIDTMMIALLLVTYTS